MSPFYAFLIALHLVLCVVLIVLVLLQNDKSGGIGAGMGGLGGGGAFTSGGAASFITKLTTGVAISFMVLVFIMNIYQPHPGGVQQSEGVLQKAAKTMTAVPMTPAAPAAGDQQSK